MPSGRTCKVLSVTDANGNTNTNSSSTFIGNVNPI